MKLTSLSDSAITQDLRIVSDVTDDNISADMGTEWVRSRCIEELLRETRRRITLVGGMWAIFLPLMGVLDYIYIPERFEFLFLSKILASLLLGIIIWFTRTRTRLDEVTLLGVIIFVLTGAVISVTSHKVELVTSNYFIGLILVIVSLIAMPWSVKEAGAVGCMVYSFYLMPLFQLYNISDMPILIVHNFFLINALLFTIIIVRNNYKIRIRALRDSIRIISYNEQLENISIRDYLTGTFNKRYFEELLEVEIHRSRRYGRPLTLVLIDVDFFKQINDRFGHAIGDRLLKNFGNILNNSIRQTDYAARIGGDEFAVVFTESSRESVMPILEDIRMKLKYETLNLEGNRVAATLSIGVAENNGTVDSVEQFFNMADGHLYNAKESGRDRIDYGLLNSSKNGKFSGMENIL